MIAAAPALAAVLSPREGQQALRRAWAKGCVG
jgi:hypothetical protein